MDDLSAVRPRSGGRIGAGSGKADGPIPCCARRPCLVIARRNGVAANAVAPVRATPKRATATRATAPNKAPIKPVVSAAGAGGHRGSPDQITRSEGSRHRKGSFRADCYGKDCRSRRRRSSAREDPVKTSEPTGSDGRGGRWFPLHLRWCWSSLRARTWEAAGFQPQDGDSSRTETKASEMVVIDADRPH